MKRKIKKSQPKVRKVKMKDTTKNTAVGKRPPAKMASAKSKKGKQPDFSFMDSVRAEEQRAEEALKAKQKVA